MRPISSQSTGIFLPNRIILLRRWKTRRKESLSKASIKHLIPKGIKEDCTLPIKTIRCFFKEMFFTMGMLILEGWIEQIEHMISDAEINNILYYYLIRFEFQFAKIFFINNMNNNNKYANTIIYYSAIRERRVIPPAGREGEFHIQWIKFWGRNTLYYNFWGRERETERKREMAAAVHCLPSCLALPSKLSNLSLNGPSTSSATHSTSTHFTSLSFSASLSHNFFSKGNQNSRFLAIIAFMYSSSTLTPQNVNN